MGDNNIKYSVFTKPWGKMPIEPLIEKVHALGFDGIELPVRDGFQIEPQNASKMLPELSRQMGAYGMEIFSVASSTDEQIFAACAEAGVPMIRIMLDVDLQLGYRASEARIRKYLESLLPLCEKYDVKIGIQQHVGKTRIKNATGLLRFLEPLPQQYFGAVWDAGHDGLRGEGPEIGLDMVWPYLYMVNLKNAYFQKNDQYDDEHGWWKPYFTTAQEGMASWPAVVNVLVKRGYTGVVCLTAEYTDEGHVDRFIEQDIAYAKSIMR